jgi:hypothetical protein
MATLPAQGTAYTVAQAEGWLLKDSTTQKVKQIGKQTQGNGLWLQAHQKGAVKTPQL